MKLFDKFKRTGKNEVENNAIENSNIAINYADSFQKKFDYSKKSINDLEDIRFLFKWYF